MLKRRPKIVRTYEAHGAIADLWDLSTDYENGNIIQPEGQDESLIEILLDGPAGTGKTRGALEWLNTKALKYPGMRAIIARKTRASLTQSVMVTFEQLVLPKNPRRVKFHTVDQSYKYPNGSEIVVGGLDDPVKILSSEYDIAYINEVVQCTKDDAEMVGMRCRWGVLPNQWLIMDANPAEPQHWVNQRCISGATNRLLSRHTDNPKYWNEELQEWAKQGKSYLATLDKLTGVRRERFFKGIWSKAEGVVYDNYDPDIHWIKLFEPPLSWRRICSIDFGFTNPFVCQWWAIDPDGRMYRYRELYGTQRLVEDWAKLMIALTGGEYIEAYVCDHDAEGRATLEKHMGIKTTTAIKSKVDGIQAVAGRLNKAGDGKPRLFFMQDALVERDKSLMDRALPCSTEEEIPGYIWKDTQKKEVPVDKDNHGCDTTRYAVAYEDLGSKPKPAESYSYA